MISQMTQIRVSINHDNKQWIFQVCHHMWKVVMCYLCYTQLEPYLTHLVHFIYNLSITYIES